VKFHGLQGPFLDGINYCRGVVLDSQVNELAYFYLMIFFQEVIKAEEVLQELKLIE
jgi:hypothetical protein